MFTGLLQVAIAAIALKCATAQNITNVTVTDVEQAFTTAKIVPDGMFRHSRFAHHIADTSVVIPSFNPTGLLNVVFFDNTTNVTVSVTPGMNLTRERELTHSPRPSPLHMWLNRLCLRRNRFAPDGVPDE